MQLSFLLLGALFLTKSLHLNAPGAEMEPASVASWSDAEISAALSMSYEEGVAEIDAFFASPQHISSAKTSSADHGAVERHEAHHEQSEEVTRNTPEPNEPFEVQEPRSETLPSTQLFPQSGTDMEEGAAADDEFSTLMHDVNELAKYGAHQNNFGAQGVESGTETMSSSTEPPSLVAADGSNKLPTQSNSCADADSVPGIRYLTSQHVHSPEVKLTQEPTYKTSPLASLYTNRGMTLLAPRRTQSLDPSSSATVHRQLKFQTNDGNSKLSASIQQQNDDGCTVEPQNDAAKHSFAAPLLHNGHINTLQYSSGPAGLLPQTAYNKADLAVLRSSKGMVLLPPRRGRSIDTFSPAATDPTLPTEAAQQYNSSPPVGLQSPRGFSLLASRRGQPFSASALRQMTPDTTHNAMTPSSGSKSSLIEEMHNEEDERRPHLRTSVAAPVFQPDEAAEQVNRAVPEKTQGEIEDAFYDSELDAPGSPTVTPAAAPQKETASAENKATMILESGRARECEQGPAAGSEEEPFSLAVIIGKVKKRVAETVEEGSESHGTKRRKTTSAEPSQTANTPTAKDVDGPTDEAAEGLSAKKGKATKGPGRRSLSKREMKGLLESKVLSHVNRGTKRTRAKTQEEKAKAPNASGAAKARHREK